MVNRLGRLLDTFGKVLVSTIGLFLVLGAAAVGAAPAPVDDSVITAEPSGEHPPPAAMDAWKRAEDLQARGLCAEASDLYEQLARNEDLGGDRVVAQLFAVDAALDAGLLFRARTLLDAARRLPGADAANDLITTLQAQLIVLERESSSSGAPFGRGSLGAAADGRPSRGLPTQARAVRAHRSHLGLEGFLVTSLGGGYDSNVALAAASAAGGDPTTQGREGDWFMSALVLADGAHPWSPGSSTELSYDFLQIAYLQPAHDSYTLQDHTARLTQRLRLRSAVSLVLDGYLGATFTGLRQGLTSFQRLSGLDAAAILEESATARLRCGAGILGRQVIDPDYRQLTGTRLEGTLQQDFRPRSWLLSLRAAYRRDRAGDIRESLGPAPSGQAGIPCAGCELSAVTPDSNRALLIELYLRSPIDSRVRVAGQLRMEDRLYDAARIDAAITDQSRLGFDYRQREDRKWTGAVEVTLGEDLAVSIRYDVTLNRSAASGQDSELCRVTQVCNPLDLQDYNYVRHMLSVDLDYDWWLL